MMEYIAAVGTTPIVAVLCDTPYATWCSAGRGRDAVRCAAMPLVAGANTAPLRNVMRCRALWSQV
jgi:hypothetical protein